MSNQLGASPAFISYLRRFSPLKTTGVILLTQLLAGCGGGDAKIQAFFKTNVQPQLSTCRVCHVPGGIADTPQGKLFMLSSSTAADYTNFKNAWSALGGGVVTNLILVKNSDASAAHTGGLNWPKTSKTYSDVSTIFQCWTDAKNCSLTGTQTTSARSVSQKVAVHVNAATDLPLLEIGQKQSPITEGCNGKPDDAPIPVDPRTLVVPGINKTGTAVQFNGFWEDLHKPVAPFKQNKYQHATTCGEWRAKVAAGKDYIMHESSFLGGTNLFTAKIYNDLWKSWELSERPANFDDELIKRYGLTPAQFHNPYPLDGEDPNLTNGGSGQLPLGLVLVKDPTTRKYTGEITISCSACHDSQLGPDFTWGRGSNSFDVGLLLSDISKRSKGMPMVFPYLVGSNAGVSNAQGVIDELFAIFNVDTLDLLPNAEVFPFHGSTGQVKTPNWWTRGYTTRIWHGSLSSDHVRSSAVLSVFNSMESGQQRRDTEAKLENVHAFLNSLAPPPFPYPEKIDLKLAEEGAVLFHKRDLWANGESAGIPKQPGNGSCASCHGVYSPRYAADSTMLPDSRLKGIAGVITPLATIRTDGSSARAFSSPALKRAWGASWWGYDDLNPNWTPDSLGGPGQANAHIKNNYAASNKQLMGPGVFTNIVGYSAPSLYGVWAAAPYFHNGSVPTIWGVLKPADRPQIWKPTIIAPIAPGLNSAVDNSYAAYDFDQLGWKFTVIPCQKGAALYNCKPTRQADGVLNSTSKTLGLISQTLPPFSPDDLEARHVTNTNDYSRSNAGHDFTKVLSDQERYAIIEYLKTL